MMLSSSLYCFSLSASTRLLKKRSKGTYTVDGFSAVQSANWILLSLGARLFSETLTRAGLLERLALAHIEVVGQTHALIRRNINALREMLDVVVHFLLQIRMVRVVHKYQPLGIMRDRRVALLIAWVSRRIPELNLDPRISSLF